MADGTGAIIGSALGSPFPPAVCIGHPGWKDAGGRTGYSMATGAVIALMCFLGLFGLLSALLLRRPEDLGRRRDPAGLVLGAIVAFIIDRRFLEAGIFALLGSALSWIGLIHGEKVEWAANPQVALGYLFMAVTVFAFMTLKLDALDENLDTAAE